MTIKGNKRLINENFSDYRLRLKNEAWMIKNHLKGTLVWNSGKNGTFRYKK